MYANLYMYFPLTKTDVQTLKPILSPITSGTETPGGKDAITAMDIVYTLVI